MGGYNYPNTGEVTIKAKTYPICMAPKNITNVYHTDI